MGSWWSKLPRGSKLSDIVVGLIMAAGLAWVALRVLPPKAALFALGLIVYEGYTITNPFKADTISESVWRLAERPMVPWLFGVATGYAVCAGLLSNDVLAVGVGFLSGHFFFQRHGDNLPPPPAAPV